MLTIVRVLIQAALVVFLSNCALAQSATDATAGRGRMPAVIAPSATFTRFDNLSQMSATGLSFTAFVVSLASTAAIHFGDLPDPVSGERAEPNLQGAAQMIDILSLLEQKTKGNLTAEERSVLEQVLYELRLRFVEATGGGKRIVEP